MTMALEYEALMVWGSEYNNATQNGRSSNMKSCIYHEYSRINNHLEGMNHHNN